MTYPKNSPNSKKVLGWVCTELRQFGRGGFTAEAVVNVLLTTEVKLEHFLHRNASKG